jgi:hypothetical protein
VRVSAPPGFRGVDYITISVQACAQGGQPACVTASKRIEVRVSAGIDQANQVGEPQRFAPTAPQWGSTVTFGAYFDPTSYDVDLSSRTTCKGIKVGTHARERVLLLNRGAAGSFDLRALGDNSLIDAEIAPARVALQRSGAEEAWLLVAPRKAGAGQRTWVTFQVLAPNGQLVAERDLCFDLEDNYEAKLHVPRLTQATDCAPASVEGVLQNTGTAVDSYQVKGPRVTGVKPEDVTLAPGESQEVKVSVDTQGLAPGLHPVTLVAVSKGGAQGTGTTTLDVKACEQVAKANATDAQAQQIRVSVEVANEFNRTLENLTAHVEGLPPQWEVLLPKEPITLQPGEKTNVTLMVRATTAEEAKNAYLVLKEGDTVIARQKLPPLSGKPSGLSGFFTLAGSNLGVIAAIIIAALVVLVLTGKFEVVKERLGLADASDPEREAYLDKLRDIRESVETGDRPTPQ